MVRIQTGATEPVEVLLVDADRKPLAGLTNVKVQIRRLSDGGYFDWSDNVFKSAGSVTEQFKALVEINPVLSKGEYRLDSAPHVKGFNTAAIVNHTANETYRVLVFQDGSPASAANVPQIGEIKEGGFVDYLDEAVSAQATPAEVQAELRAIRLHQLVAVNPGALLPGAGTYIRQILDGIGGLGGAVYHVKQSYAFDPVANAITGQVWVESGNLVVVTPVSASISWYGDDGTLLFTEAAVGPDAQGVFKVTKASPGLVKSRSYYALASVEITGHGTVRGAKGAFTIG